MAAIFVPVVNLVAHGKYTPCCPCGWDVAPDSFSHEEALAIAWIHAIKSFDHKWEEDTK